MDQFMEAAFEEAQKGLAEGGIPIGSVLVIAGENQTFSGPEEYLRVP